MGVHHRDLRDRRPRMFSGQATCVLDQDGHFLNVSPSLAAFFHCDGAAMRGRNLLSYVEEGEADQLAPVLAAVRGGRSASFEVRLLDPAGTPTWVTMELGPGGEDAVGGPLLVACFRTPAEDP